MIMQVGVLKISGGWGFNLEDWGQVGRVGGPNDKAPSYKAAVGGSTIFMFRVASWF